MNIFVLDEDPTTAAQMHCDKHVPKMCVEAAQMMAYYHSKQFAKWEKGTPAPDWWRGVEVTA